MDENEKVLLRKGREKMKTKVSKFLALILAALMFISMVPAAGMRNVNAAPKNPDLLKSRLPYTAS